MNRSTHKIIVSGNPEYGLARALSTVFHNIEFFSRSSQGFDFSEEKFRREFAIRSLGYDVYVSCSSLENFDQALLLESVALAWQRESKAGQILVLGSLLESFVNERVDLYSVHKKALRALCRRLSLNAVCVSDQPRATFKITYLSTGYLDTPGPMGEGKVKISCQYVAGVIDWVLSQPPHVNVSEILLEPIQ